MRILTFDIEEWFHILDNPSTRTEEDWEKYPKRLEQNVGLILEILSDSRTSATFFCLGWVAERFPSVIRRIAESGYEVASHSYAHQLSYEQTPEAFSEDLGRSIAIIEDAIGHKVRTYRAPGFSLKPQNTWVLDVLIEHGIEVDCSIFPARRGHGGFAQFGAAEPVIIQRAQGTLKEFPVNVVEILGINLVFSGGGYFRVFPYPLLRHLFARSPYVMTYFHPRDFDPEQPRIEGLSLFRQFKSYYGLRGTERKLRRLLRELQFTDVRTAVEQTDWQNVTVVSV